MAVTAITGEIGSGKSTASHILAGLLGCEYINADSIAKSLWERSDVKARAAGRWGRGILDASGRIILALAAERIFSSKAEHDFCNALLHPLVMSELQEMVQGRDAVLEIPLLPEAGRPKWIDRVIYVAAKFETRAERVRARGWDAEELRRRESFLLPERERIAVCNIVIRNDGGTDELQRQLEEAK
ncbi:MAG: dephospho-CoA kinase [Synergistaceae bacterium]|nr:dephospho-CoA kinase [Synergistaceae bacterium]